MAQYAAQQVGIAWSPEQLVRLEHEWRQLQRNFAYHPHVRIVPLRGSPPGEYQVEFTVRSLFVRDDGQLDYIATPSVQIWLPPGYPHEAPVVRPVQALFHPNITMDGIGVNPAWDPTRTLAQLVQQVGAVLAYHTYDPWNVWNPAAMDWATANAGYLPTDPAANLSPNADGEPLGRICQHGRATLEELRTQLQTLCTALTATDAPPAMSEVRAFTERARLTTNLFTDDDVPDYLRTPATELDEWAAELPSTTMALEGLRQRHIAAAATLAAAAKLADSRRALLKEIGALADLVHEPPVADPYQAMAQLPPLPQMQAVQVNLRVAITEAEKRVAAVQARLTALTEPEQRSGPSHSALLEQFAQAEGARASTAVRDARDKGEAAIATIASTVERAKDELEAFTRVIGWREYGVLTVKSRELVGRILGWGAAGVQAYFVENEGGVFGPFEFERRLDLGESALAVRNTGRTGIEVFDLTTGGKVAQSDTGETTIQLPGGEEGVGYETTFRLTARCDDLWVQIEYLTRQVADRLTRLSKPSGRRNAESWVNGYLDVLSRPAALSRFVEETREGIMERDSLITDLKQVGRFKERMTTQFLLERYVEMIPRFKKDQAAAHEQLQDANRRIAAIFSKSQREMETGVPMIPPRLLGEYETQTKRRDDAQRKIDRLGRRFDLAVAQIRPRLATPALYGSDHAPATILLPALPQELRDRAPMISAAALDELVTSLEEDLGMPLRPQAGRTTASPAVAAAPAGIPAAPPPGSPPSPPKIQRPTTPVRPFQPRVPAPSSPQIVSAPPPPPPPPPPASLPHEPPPRQEVETPAEPSEAMGAVNFAVDETGGAPPDAVGEDYVDFNTEGETRHG